MAMTRRFTDHDGLSWAVEWSEGEVLRFRGHGPRRVRRGIVFERAGLRFLVPMENRADPASLPDEELQAMMDREFRQ